MTLRSFPVAMEQLLDPESGPVPRLDPRAEELRVERQRHALECYESVRQAPDTLFADIVELAAQLCDVPRAAVSLMDESCHTYVGRKQMEVLHLPRGAALSELAVQEETLVVIEDTLTDPRSADNPFVTGGPMLRSFAAVPICPDGVPVGAVSVADVRPRRFSPEQLEGLQQLARCAEQLLRSRLLMDDFVALARENMEVRRSYELLQDLTEAVGDAPDFGAACRVVLEEICRTTGWSLGQVWERRADGETLACTQHHPADPRVEGASFLIASREIYLEPGEDLPGTAWKRGQHVWMPALGSGDFPRIVSAQAAELETGMAFPVKAGDEVVAVLEFFAPQPKQEDTQLVRLISSVTGELGTVFLRKRAEEELEHHVGHDALTGIPNRLLFMDRLGVALSDAERSHRAVGVLYLGLGDVERVNALGHAAGDEFLRGVATRLQGQLRKSDTLARVGGGIFAVLLRDLTTPEEAEVVASKLLRALEKPFQVQDQQVYANVSVGISIAPEDGTTPDALAGNADSAMTSALESGRGAVAFFVPEMLDHAREKLVTDSALRQAIERREFVVHYQPQIDVSTGAIVGVEALVRWQHPERGLVPPMEFIPVAESTGLIEPIGDLVLEAACLQARVWEHEHGSVVPIAVNLSLRQFQNPGLVQRIQSHLERTGLAPERLELEITESVAMRDVAHTIRTIHELAALGVGVALDDFGVGYSSLFHLKSMPISRLKVDRAFIRDLAGDTKDVSILETIIALVEKFNISRAAAGKEAPISVVAEGVETNEQLEILRRLQCPLAQGYLFGRPTSPDKLGPLLGRSR